MLYQIVKTYTKRFTVQPVYFDTMPRTDTGLMICIPAFKEPDILATLRSLATCTSPVGAVELIIVVNAPEDADKKTLDINTQTVSQINQWIENERPDFINTYIIREESILKKDAGAGMARKIGMDEAVQRWGMIQKDGPIVCLDADCTVSVDYLVEAEKAFMDTRTKVGHFQFEHVYEKEQDLELRAGIIQYELHLRCYIEGLRQAGYPNAIHTVGSCMAVRASSYAKAGGMNKRKAGEDFYFLHKVIPLGGWKNIGAVVYPSCRVSDRVPFGTGRAQSEWVTKKEKMTTYHPGIYKELKKFFGNVSSWNETDIQLEEFSSSVRDFLLEIQLVHRVNEIRNQSSSSETFRKHFWQWMDGFLVLKFTHYLRDHGFKNQSVEVVSKELLALHLVNALDIPESLHQFRVLDSRVNTVDRNN